MSPRSPGWWRSAPVALALIAILGCSSAARKSPETVDLIGVGSTPFRVTEDGRGLPASAASFGLASAPVQEAEAAEMVASLLERRGWRRAGPAEPADTRVVVESDASSSVGPSVPAAGGREKTARIETSISGGHAYVLGPSKGITGGGSPPGRAGARSLRQVSVEIRTEDSEEVLWRAVAWDHGEVPATSRSALRLAAAFADRLPAAPVPSPERRAVDRLGFDFLVFGPDIVVLEVAAGGVAAAAGWQPGDRLLEIEGAGVEELGWAAIAGRLAAAENEPVRVELLRAGERYLTFLVPPGPRRLG